jgi:hypothetical protein
MKKFKYKAEFSCIAKVVIPTDKDKYLAIASLEKLKGIFPTDLNPEDDNDLLYIAGNAAVAGMINLNDDGVSKETGLKIAKKFKKKFIDVEHNRNYIVGCLSDYGFSTYGGNELLSQGAAAASVDPFNISVGGFVWKAANSNVTDFLVESSDEGSEYFGSVSFSWEIGFDEFVIALGSKIISEATIISDAEEILKYSKYLRAFGGCGRTEDGTAVYRVIVGDAVPLGVGLVGCPAADVKGIATLQNENSDTEENDAAQAKELEKENNLKNLEKNKENNVKDISTMKSIASLEDITDESLKETTASVIKNFIGQQIADKINEISTDYANQLEAKTQEIKEKQEKLAEFNEQIKATETKINELNEKLAAEQEARASEKAVFEFNSRMADIESKFNLTEKDSEIVAKNIRGLDEAAYATWYEEFSVIASAKKKCEADDKSEEEVKKKAKKDKEDAEDEKDGGDDEKEEGEAKKAKAKKEAAASIEADLDKLDENGNTLANSSEATLSVKEKFAKAFKLEDFKLKFSVK